MATKRPGRQEGAGQSRPRISTGKPGSEQIGWIGFQDFGGFGETSQSAGVNPKIGSGVYSPYMADQMERAQVEDMIARSAAETGTKLANMETRIADMNGKLDRIIDRFDSLSSDVAEVKLDNQRTRGTVRTTAITLGGVLLTAVGLIVAVANSSFTIGGKVAETARSQAREVYNEMGKDEVTAAGAAQTGNESAVRAAADGNGN